MEWTPEIMRAIARAYGAAFFFEAPTRIRLDDLGRAIYWR